MTAVAATLARWGGMLAGPRATLAGLPDRVGARDGVALLLLYAVGAHLPAIGDAVADALAMSGMSALTALLSGLAAIIPWLVATIAVEAVLGSQRSHRAALCLVPMLVLTSAARLLAGLQVLRGPPIAPEIVGALAAVALAIRVRPAIPAAEAAPTGAPPPRRAAVILGVLVLALPLASATRDAIDLAGRWHELAPVAEGDLAPPFQAEDLSGVAFTQDDLRGAPHLLVFWTSWCGVCMGEMPMYTALHRDFSAAGLEVIGVNCDRDGDQPAIAARYVRDHELPFRVVLDRGSLDRAFHVSMYPTLVLVDADGRVRWVHQGRAFERSVRAAIAGVLPSTR